MADRIINPCMYCPAGKYDEVRCPPVCEFGKLKKQKEKDSIKGDKTNKNK